MSKAFLRSIEAEALDHLRALVGISSFTRDRAGVNRCGDACASWFSSLGFTERRVPSTSPECGDHRIWTNGPDDAQATGLILVAHLDTVYPADTDFSWREEGDRLYGPGVADIKGGIAVIAMALRAVAEAEPGVFARARFTVLLNATEEGGCEDFPGLARGAVRPGDRAALVFETGFPVAGGASTVVVSRKGAARWRVRVEGKEAHSGNAHASGASAIRELCRLVERIESWTDPGAGRTFNVGLIEGGTAVNAVPRYSAATVDLRTVTRADHAWGREKMASLAGNGSVESADGAFRTRVFVDELPGYPPWEPNEASDRLGALAVATGRELGLRVVPERRGGASDGAHLADLLPTLDGLGPVGRHTHCSVHDPARGLEQESADRPSFVARALLAARLMRRLLGG